MKNKHHWRHIDIIVVNGEGAPLPSAQLTLKGDGVRLTMSASEFSASDQIHDLPDGKYWLEAEAAGYQSQKRLINVTGGVLRAPFVLGKKGDAFFHINGVAFPVGMKEGTVGVMFPKGKIKESTLKALQESATKRGASLKWMGKKFNEDGILMLSPAKKQTKASLKSWLKEVRSIKEVAFAGPMVGTSPDEGAIMTGRQLVIFNDSLSWSSILNHLDQAGLKLLERVPGLPNGYYVELVETESDFSILRAANALLSDGIAVATEPDLVLPVENDALPPTDALYLEQWTFASPNVPGAWGALNAANPPGVVLEGGGDLTYGGENIILAVVDQGIHTITTAGGTTVAAHPDFAGNVTSGQPKLYMAADWNVAPVVLNNDNPTGSHGMGCAGAAVAKESNVPFNGVASEGVVGVAPNVRLMGLIRGGFAAGAWTRYMSMFIWTAGLPSIPPNPGQINPAAHIISNSWGIPQVNLAALPGTTSVPGFPGLVGAPIAFSNTFLALTTFGRNGRGTLLFFSTGNNIAPVAAAGQRPFSTNPRTFGIGASSLNTFPIVFANEIGASYSNFGGAIWSGQEISLVAPSHDPYILPSPPNEPIQHNPNVSFGAISSTLHSEGMLAGGARIASTLSTAAAGAGVSVINVANGQSQGFNSSSVLLIGPAGAPTSAHYINATNSPAFPAPDTITIARNFGVAVPAGSNLIGLSGNLPGGVGQLQTTLATATVAGQTQVHLGATSGFVPGQQIFFDTPGGPSYAAATILTIDSFEYLTLTGALAAAIPVGTAVTGIAIINTTVVVPNPVAVGASTTVEVASIAGFVAGQQVLFGAPGGGTSELRTIIAVAPAAPPAVPNPTITVGPVNLANVHPVGAQVAVVGGLVQTTLTAGVAVGAGNINVVSTAGFQIGQAIVFGTPVLGGALVEFNIVSGFPTPTSITLGKPILKAQVLGTVVWGGAPSYTTSFGGTSYATPFSAGVASLVLTAKPTLTWVEVRDIMRSTAVKIVPLDATVNGRWADQNGVLQGAVGYAGPVYSPVYGYGRVDANAAVVAALAYSHDGRDLMVRNTLNDSGAVATNPATTIIDSPDIWIRNANPTTEGAAVALPPAMINAGPHQKPVRSNPRWIYVRVSNRGNALPSLHAWVRLYLAVSDVEPDFNFPDAWFNCGAPGGVSSGINNLYLLNDNVATPVGGTSLFNVAFQPNPAPGIPALVRTGIANGGFHITWVQWNQGDIPPIPYRYRVIQTIAGNAAIDTVLFLENTMRLSVGQQVIFGVPTAANHRVRTIGLVNNDTSITLTAAVGAAFPLNTPIIPLSTLVNTTLAVASAGGGGATSAIQVNDATQFRIGQYILLGVPGTPTSEIVSIVDLTLTAAGNDTITVTPGDANVHAVGDPVTLISNPIRTFVVAEVSPHDGLLAGNNFHNNSNITYKEVNLLVDIAFRNLPDTTNLTGNVVIDEAGTPVTTNFRINLDDGENFITENTIIRVTRHHVIAANTETIYFRFSGGAWGFDTPPVGGWLVVNNPLTGALLPAAGAQTHAHFNGSFTVDPNHNKVSFTVIAGANYVPPGGPAVPFTNTKSHEAVVFTQPAGASQLGLTQSAKPKLHIWTDMALLDMQADVDAYGPLLAAPTTQFHLSSMFTSSAATVPAYAAVTGTIFVQRDDLDANKVNLYLKPLHQSRIGYTPVRYFVYRGLTLTDFLQGPAPADEDKVRSLPGSAFITYLHSVYAQLAADAGVAPAAFISSKAIGWDRPAQPGASPVDQYFFSLDPNYQLPVVPMGMVLGNFFNGGGSKFGFEIILEEGSYSPDLNNARASDNILNVGILAGAALRAKQEEILNYIDPAAYYGMHFFSGVHTTDASPIKKEADLFNWAVVKFFTRDRVYIDLRNENGYSLNYYQNYTDGSGNQVQLGQLETLLTALPYQSNSWPILFWSSTVPVATENTPVFLRLRIDDNLTPLAFVEWSELVTPSTVDKFIAGNDLTLPGVNTWTKAIGFANPNVVNPADINSRILVSQVVKLHYFRQINPATLWPATVVRTESHLANVFGPIGLAANFAGVGNINWTSAQDRRFVDNMAVGGAAAFAYVAERGVAYESARVIYWASATDRYDSDIGVFTHQKGVTSGTSTSGNFFEVGYMFRGLQMNIQPVTDVALPVGSQVVRTLNFVQVANGEMTAEHLILLGITNAEATVLANIPLFSAHHEKHILLVDVGGGSITDPNGIVYRKYRLRVTGVDAGMNYIIGDPANNVPPDPDIFVYSANQLVFVSKAFGDLQPNPVVYGASAEELLPDSNLAVTGPMVAADALTETLVNDFTALVAAVPNDPAAGNALSNLVVTHADDLWSNAVTFAQANFDDRVLYLARNKMRYELRRHPYFLGKDAERNTTTAILERLSRNKQGGVDFTGVPAATKKIVVIGFDPSLTTYQTMNPSGVTALALHGAAIASGPTNGAIRSLVLPLRYSDFDAGMVSGIFDALIAGSTADLVIVLGFDYVQSTFDVERVAGRWRGTLPDNENTVLQGDIAVGNTFQRFYETNLSAVALTALVPGPFVGLPGQWLYFDESAVSTTQTKLHPTDVSAPPNGNATSYLLNTMDGDPRKGSGGDSFGNETYYRLCQKWGQYGTTSTVKIAMVTLPDPANVTGGAIPMAQVVQRVRDMLTNMLTSL